MANEQNLREPWKPGQSGNPKGRPKNRVPEQLVTIFGSKAKAKKFYCLSATEINEWEAAILTLSAEDLKVLAKWSGAPSYPKGLAIAVLSDMKIESPDDMVTAAKAIFEKYGCAVLLKGGHAMNDANDLLYTEEGSQWFYGKKIDNPNTHGTGCTLSSAIASNLAKGMSMKDAVEKGKEYISLALGAMLNLGAGSGPMNHGFAVTTDWEVTK